MYNIFSSQNVI